MNLFEQYLEAIKISLFESENFPTIETDKVYYAPIGTVKALRQTKGKNLKLIYSILNKFLILKRDKEAAVISSGKYKTVEDLIDSMPIHGTWQNKNREFILSNNIIDLLAIFKIKFNIKETNGEIISSGTWKEWSNQSKEDMRN